MQNTNKNKIEFNRVVEYQNIIGTQRIGLFFFHTFFLEGIDQKRIYKEIVMFKQDLKGSFTLEDITWENGWGGKGAMGWMGGKESLQVKLAAREHRVCLECQNRGLES